MRRALIFWGGWEGHEPGASAGVVRGLLEAEGFEVRVERGADGLADPAIRELDLIVPVMTMTTISKEAAAGLSAAIEGGVGLAGFHGGAGDSFRDCVEYQFIVGGQWVAHPGNVIDYTVEITRPDDPVVAGIGDFAYRSEQYYMHVDPGNEVLATTTFDGTHCAWVKGVAMPVVWKRRHGRGRVFYSSLGHKAAEFEVPQMREIFRRGMLWAAR